jgi:hypothetical protein
MSGKRDSARNALRRAVPFLAEQHHDAILNELDAESLLDGEGKRPNGGRVHAVAGDAPKKSLLMTPVQASAARQENVELVRQCRATCARLGYVMKENELVDVHALNKVLAGQDVDTRMRLKSQLYTLHMIPA